MSKVLTWNNIPSSTQDYLIIGEIVRDPIGGIRTTLMDVPGMEGAWVFPQKRGMRKITVNISISAPTQELLREAVADFAEWIDVENEAKLAISDDPGIYHLATLESIEPEGEWRGLARFTARWSAQPYSLADTVTTESWTDDESHTHSWSPDTGALVYPVIQITPNNGSLTDFTLTTNGEQLSYEGGNILSGNSITINSITGVVTAGPNTDTELTGAFDPDDLILQYVVGSTFPELMPGVTNTIQFTRTGGTATSITISVKFRKKFRR